MENVFLDEIYMIWTLNYIEIIKIYFFIQSSGRSYQYLVQEYYIGKVFLKSIIWKKKIENYIGNGKWEEYTLKGPFKLFRFLVII